MGTVSGPPVSLNQARAAMNRGPGSLAELRRGAGIVPDIPQNANVPTGFPIGLSQLAGATDYVPMSISVAQMGGNMFINEPAPVNTQVSGGLRPTITNGTGNYTVVWSLVNSNGASNFNWSQNGRDVTGSARVLKNSLQTITFQLQVSDGVSTRTFNSNLTLAYNTDL